jgi:hypothetical protein
VIVNDLEFSNVSCWDYVVVMGSRGERSKQVRTRFTIQ